MDTRDRITLLDNLFALNEEARLDDAQVVRLWNLLAGLSDEVRESFLQYLQEGDRYNRLERLTRIAMLEPPEQVKVLRAVGIQATTTNIPFAEFLNFARSHFGEATRQIDELAKARKTLEEEFLAPLLKMFGFRNDKENKK